MSIHFQCPNGHALKIGEQFAGHTAHCPSCQAPVLIPQRASRISDDAIVDLLGPPGPSAASAPPPMPASAEAVDATHRKRSLNQELASRGLKMCPKCHREVGIGYAVCIYCRTYFNDRTEIARRQQHAPRR